MTAKNPLFRRNSSMWCGWCDAVSSGIDELEKRLESREPIRYTAAGIIALIDCLTSDLGQARDTARLVIRAEQDRLYRDMTGRAR